MAMGLTYDEYLELRHSRPVLSNQQTQTIENHTGGLAFPMTIAEAANHVRLRGYDCLPASLKILTNHQVIEPGSDGWRKVDVDAACEYFEEIHLFTSYVEMCRVLGCCFASFLRALNASAQLATEKYGIRVRADDQLFVMHRAPSREEHNAIIYFELCDDIREMLERGEYV